MLQQQGVKFDNVCLDTHEEFLSLKDAGDLLFGQLPLLRIDGLKLTQSQVPILCYPATFGVPDAEAGKGYFPTDA